MPVPQMTPDMASIAYDMALARVAGPPDLAREISPPVVDLEILRRILADRGIRIR